MDENRIKRYRDKLNIIKRRIEQIEEWMDDFTRDEKTRLAVYKAFQEIVESSMDLLSMMCVDLKITPKDDYTNIEEISKIVKEIDEKILKEANGLRNVIVHRYNGVDDFRAYEGIKRMLPYMGGFVKVVEKWIMESY